MQDVTFEDAPLGIGQGEMWKQMSEHRKIEIQRGTNPEEYLYATL